MMPSVVCPKNDGCKMRMIRWMYGHNRRDKMRNEVVHIRWKWPL